MLERNCSVRRNEVSGVSWTMRRAVADFGRSCLPSRTSRPRRDQRPVVVERTATRRRGADVRPMAVRLTAKVLSGRKDLPNTVLSGRKDLLSQSSATAPDDESRPFFVTLLPIPIVVSEQIHHLARGRGWIQSAASHSGDLERSPVVKSLNLKDRRWKPDLSACRMSARAHCLMP